MKISNNVKSVLGSLAPMIGTAVGGPYGALARKALQEALGVENEEEAYSALEKDPEAIAKVRVAELEFKQAMSELGLKEQDLHARNTANARDMAKNTTLAPQMIMSLVYSSCYFFMIYMLFAGQISVAPEYQAVAIGIVGSLSTIQIQILNFWFGSSSGSKQKTDAMKTGGGALPAVQ